MSKHEPAFPTQMWDEELKEATWIDGGLTKRELIAAMAMQGFITGVFTNSADGAAITDENGCTQAASASEIADFSVRYADALLAELLKERG